MEGQELLKVALDSAKRSKVNWKQTFGQYFRAFQLSEINQNGIYSSPSIKHSEQREIPCYIISRLHVQSFT